LRAELRHADLQYILNTTGRAFNFVIMINSPWRQPPACFHMQMARNYRAM